MDRTGMGGIPQQQRMPTAMRPLNATTAKPPGSRMGTAMRGDPNFTSVGVTSAQTMKFHDRPVTQHGMQGMQVKQQGQGRVYQDRSFFLQQLRSKCSEIVQEIEKFKKQSEDINKDNQLFIQLEKRYEELTKEVRNLEGKLADYNLAFDKQRAQTRPEEIHQMYEHIKFQNDRFRQQLDEIFIERKNQEEQIQALENQIQQINQIAQLKINELDPDQRQDYENLVNENRNLLQEINNQRMELDELNNKLLIQENKLRMDSQKLKGQLLKEQIVELDRKKADLEVQLNEANLSFPEARDRLLARIKDDNNYIQNVDKRVKEIRKNIDNYEKKLKEINDELENKKGREEEKKKYEILYQRDKEMTEFIDTYDQQRNSDIEQLQQIEHNIVELLEQSSKILAITGQLPTKEEFRDLEQDLMLKSNQVEVAEKTLQKLKLEYEQRSKDVKKLDEAEERVAVEMKKLNEQISKMEEEISQKFEKSNEIKNEFESKKRRLQQEKDQLKQYKTTVVEEIRKIKYDHDVKEKKLTMHEIYATYSDAEKKLVNSENQVYNLKSFIIAKSRDMNYEQIKQECKTQVEELNKLIIKHMN